jgi:hypothetical protein
MDSVKANHEYKIQFRADTISHSTTSTTRSIRDNFITTSGYSVYDKTSKKFVYREDYTSGLAGNWFNSKISPLVGNTATYWFPNSSGVTSDVFQGLQLSFLPLKTENTLNEFTSGWVKGKAPIEVTVQPNISPFFAYDYDIVFTDSLYTTKTIRATISPIRDLTNNVLSPAKVLLKESFPFYVINKSIPPDANGNYEKLDLVVQDVNGNRAYDKDVDYVLAGYSANGNFLGTVFGIRFPGPDYPKSGDVYRLDFNQPLKDSIMFKVNYDPQVSKSTIKEDMQKIRAVPNPYIVTNTMEPALSNTGLNQQRQLMFTHIPAQCTIKIFTSSGVFVQELYVDNAADNGTYHWDMLTKEGLEIAAGIYVFLVESKATGDKKIGKFAVIK